MTEVVISDFSGHACQLWPYMGFARVPIQHEVINPFPSLHGGAVFIIFFCASSVLPNASALVSSADIAVPAKSWELVFIGSCEAPLSITLHTLFYGIIW